jgi:hypothetical protein
MILNSPVVSILRKQLEQDLRELIGTRKTVSIALCAPFPAAMECHEEFATYVSSLTQLHPHS